MISGKRVWMPALILCLFIAATGCAKKEKPSSQAREQAPQYAREPSPKKDEVPAPQTAAQIGPLEIKEEKVLFDFEENDQGWGIPFWAEEQDDYVATSSEVSQDAAKTGKNSIKLNADFDGTSWKAALVEVEQYFDWTPYKAIMVDVYIPKETPEGLRAKIILTVGDDWRWTEMSTAKQLAPGEWTTIVGDLRPGSYDWKRTIPTDAFRADVRKIAVRVESNRRPIYKGPIYIDNVRLGK